MRNCCLAYTDEVVREISNNCEELLVLDTGFRGVGCEDVGVCMFKWTYVHVDDRWVAR